MVKTTQKALWRALSSPIRRRMLDRLRRGPRTTGQLARAFPGLSRFAVMQHLGVLADAKLILVERRGRQRWNYLNAMPLHALYRRWVNRFADDLADSAERLKHLAEDGAESGAQSAERNDLMSQIARSEEFRVLELKLHYAVQAPPERVWRIMTQRTNEWWKRAKFYARPDAVAFHMELKAGGRMWEEFADGGSLLWWTINEIVPGKTLGFTGVLTAEHGGPTYEQTKIELVEAGQGCTVTLSHVMTGLIRDREKTTNTFVGGWNQLFQEGLKPLAEESAHA